MHLAMHFRVIVRDIIYGIRGWLRTNSQMIRTEFGHLLAVKASVKVKSQLNFPTAIVVGVAFEVPSLSRFHGRVRKERVPPDDQS